MNSEIDVAGADVESIWNELRELWYIDSSDELAIDVAFVAHGEAVLEMARLYSVLRNHDVAMSLRPSHPCIGLTTQQELEEAENPFRGER